MYAWSTTMASWDKHLRHTQSGFKANTCSQAHLGKHPQKNTHKWADRVIHVQKHIYSIVHWVAYAQIRIVFLNFFFYVFFESVCDLNYVCLDFILPNFQDGS